MEPIILIVAACLWVLPAVVVFVKLQQMTDAAQRTAAAITLLTRIEAMRVMKEGLHLPVPLTRADEELRQRLGLPGGTV